MVRGGNTIVAMIQKISKMWGFFALKTNYLYDVWSSSAYPANFNGVVLGVGDHVELEDPVWLPEPFFVEQSCINGRNCSALSPEFSTYTET